MRGAATAAALTALALTLTACGGVADDSTSGSSPAADASDAPAAGGTAQGPMTFQSLTTDGEDFDATELAGQDVVLWFWAPWCTICRSEAAHVAEAAMQVEGVEVVGVASSGSLEDMQAFVDETGAGSLTHVADVPGDVWQQFGVVAQPTYVFVDDDGRTQSFAGALSQAALVDAMQQLADA